VDNDACQRSPTILVMNDGTERSLLTLLGPSLDGEKMLVSA